jgi:hypothetical protein
MELNIRVRGVDMLRLYERKNYELRTSDIL